MGRCAQGAKMLSKVSLLTLGGRRSSVVEQLIRNQQVGGSIPLAGSRISGQGIFLFSVDPGLQIK